MEIGCLLLVASAGWGIGAQLLKASDRSEPLALAEPREISTQNAALVVPGALRAVLPVSSVLPAPSDPTTSPADILVQEPGVPAVIPKSVALDPRPGHQWVGFDLKHWLQPHIAAQAIPSIVSPETSDQAEAATSQRQVLTFLSRNASTTSDSVAQPVGASVAVSANTPAVLPDIAIADPPTADIDEVVDPLAALRERYTNQLVAFYPIGWSSTDPGRRHVGWSLRTQGWMGFVQQRIIADLDWGYRRIQLHNPFGDDGEWPMELDQSVRAEAAGLDWLTAGFVEAWRPVTRGDYTGGDPVEVIAYMGTARLSPFLELQADGDWEAWLARAEASVALPLAAGMTLAFDSFSIEAEDSFSFRFAQKLKAQGVKVYIETWPRRPATHWHSTNVMVAEKWFQRNHQSPNVARRSDLTGEVVRLLNQPIDETDLPNATKLRVIEGLLHGYTVSLRSDRMYEQVPDLDTLLRDIDAFNFAAYD